jgi:hypothetical protein
VDPPTWRVFSYTYHLHVHSCLSLSPSLCQELAEASEAYHATAAELQEVKAKLDATSREMRRTGLTKDEVAGLPPEVCCKESPAQPAYTSFSLCSFLSLSEASFPFFYFFNIFEYFPYER